MRLPSSASAPGVLGTILSLVVLGLLSSAARGDVEWEDVLRVTDNIVCTCGCPPTVLSACSCGRAFEMNREVRGMLEESKSDEEIYEFYVDFLIWIGIVVMVLGGLFTLIPNQRKAVALVQKRPTVVEVRDEAA